MNIKQVFSILALLAYASSNVVAMQQQQIQKQDQQQQKHDHKHDHDKDNADANPPQDDALTTLNTLMQTLVDKVNATHGSVDNMIKKAKDHPRICPTCGQLASTCPTDRERIRNGNIMTCGCDMCGGRKY